MVSDAKLSLYSKIKDTWCELYKNNWRGKEEMDMASHT